MKPTHHLYALSRLLSACALCVLVLLVFTAIALTPSVTGTPIYAHENSTSSAEELHNSSLNVEGCWSRLETPNFQGDNYLNGVAVLSPNNVWAVGYVLRPGGGARTLITRWNGSTWTMVASPDAVSADDRLFAVAANSATDIWAVGRYTGEGGYKTLTLRYDGSSWSIVTSPNIGTGNNVLLGVTAISAGDIWAVGSYFDLGNSALRTLTMRWVGTRWVIYPSSNVGLEFNSLKAVDAFAANDVWAVGEYSTSSTPRQRTLILRWNGSVWSTVNSPNPGSSRNDLHGITALSGTDVWAVGTYRNNPGKNQTLTMRWNGAQWSTVNSPSPGTDYNALLSVAAISTNDVWAVGTYFNEDEFFRTLAMHWNGSVWTIVNTPNSGDLDELRSVVAASANDVWAVGKTRRLEDDTSTLAVRFTNPCAVAPTPSATSTATQQLSPTASPVTTNTSTPTGTPPTSTSTATGTPPTATATSRPTLTRTQTAVTPGTPIPTISVPTAIYQPGGTGNFPFAHPAFERVWDRTDHPVRLAQVSRTWFWGPGPNSRGLREQYNESPTGDRLRLVQYFDKSRMEVNDPSANQNQPFFVTNGLLTVELISGFIQVGQQTFTPFHPACIPMSGDFGDTLAPTYFAFQRVSNTQAGDNPAPNRSGERVTETINRVGNVGTDPSKYGVEGVELIYYEGATKHNIPRIFWNFLNSSGQVHDPQHRIVIEQLIQPWFFASGLPISEAYWAKATIAGRVTDVLIQAYERRVLTYVPSNPEGFQVEMGNIGQHYFDWRYRNSGYCPGRPPLTPTPPNPTP